MKRFLASLNLLAILVIALLSACDELPPELITPSGDIPVPTAVTGSGGSQSVTLSWSFDAAFTFSEFVIFRSDDDEATYSEIGRVVTPPYTDANLRAGTLYWYRIAGVDESGVVGRRSTAIPVTAAIYEVVINDGAVVTGSRDVLLIFTAGIGTQNVRVSEDAAFTGAQWLDFAPSLPFNLSGGDGSKQVYAEFADAAGNTTQAVSATITLDTFSEISSLSFSPPTIAPGGTVHLRVEPTGNELNGFCEVFIEGQGETPVPVFDEGNNGDPQAGDGVYEIDYTFPLFFRQESMRMSAVFIDEAGNASVEVEFATNLMMSDPPAAVALLAGAADSTVDSITMRWTQSDDLHFASYELYREPTGQTIDPNTSVLAGRITQIGNTQFTDQALDEAATYDYSVYVVNDFDEKTASNLRSFSTADLPPGQVTLDPPSAIGATRLTLTWSVNNDTDFARYEVRFDTAPGVTEASQLAATITDRLTSFFDHTGLDTGTNTYYYRVIVVDAGGQTSRSNEVSTAIP